MGLYKKKSVSSGMQLLTWKPSHLLALKNHGGSKTDVMRSFPPSKNAICDQPLLTITPNEKEFNPTSISSLVLKSAHRKRPINIIFLTGRSKVFHYRDLFSGESGVIIEYRWLFSERNAELPKQTPECANSPGVYHTICINWSTKKKA